MTTVIQWTGKSGQAYMFELYLLGTHFRAEPGVYVFASPTFGMQGRYKAEYVGETRSLRERIDMNLASHEAFPCATRRGATHVGVLHVPDSRLRLSIETDLRHALDPHCNLQGIPAKPRGLGSHF